MLLLVSKVQRQFPQHVPTVFFQYLQLVNIDLMVVQVDPVDLTFFSFELASHYLYFVTLSDPH